MASTHERDAEIARFHALQDAAAAPTPYQVAQRQKQIDYGKNTPEYDYYLETVPRNKRDRRVHPMTPNVHGVYSKRQFDGLVKTWRRQLHVFKPPIEPGTEDLFDYPTRLPVFTNFRDDGPPKKAVKHDITDDLLIYSL